ncbi:uncharacterized protein F4822DRAFT_434256 [Hypoxylon trugodes]|uniref:uncharacterized protein n=1 Tax=Hypoxylon trugodes TaxID=326681 RepID=UPI0021A1FF30|nr:uncharacterized protein F4822DRAFT_434256 [Hypoxylon trugodes]KAI1384322.1 hypothetical protein F4822DRAFT_434256 [Hypoxylon trugodes]
MASIQSMSGFGAHGSANKISKSRAKTAVKPILKKLSSSQSEKTSLDLDRAWSDQDAPHRSHESRTGGVVVIGGAGIGGGSSGSGGGFYEQSSKDTSLTFNDTVETRRYNHSRSISGTSHISVATSSSSGPRHQVGTPFVHPFQQIPRTATPPLSYANSQTSFFDITEDEDNDTDNNPNNNSSSSRNSLHNHPTSPHSLSQPSLGLRRPSITTSQRTSSFSDVHNAYPSSPHPPHQPPSLRINTSRIASTTPAQSSRLANVSSRSDIHLDCMLESPSSVTNAASNLVGSPASSTAPMSPLRSSFDAAGFPRLRAKSDLDTATRAEHLREARRKFELREKAKEEKYAREEIKRRERADNKRAHELEKHAAALHKEHMAAVARQEAAELEEAIARGKHNRKFSAASSGRPSLAISRTSMSRPGTSRKNAPSPLGEAERFASSNYDSLDARSPPSFGNEAGGAQSVVFQSSKRKNKAKKKTQSTWTMFILWLRTKLLRASKGR